MPPTLINLDFLKSGGEFKPTARFLKAAETEGEPHERKSKNHRLEEFYQQTLQAVEAASTRKSAKDSKASVLRSSAEAAQMMRTKSNADTPTMVNLEYLRSGLEFKRQRMKTVPAGAETGGRGLALSRNGRLKDFYDATLSAAAEAKATLKATETAADADRRAKANLGTPTMVNLEFLRSGLEFVRTGTTTVWAFSQRHGAFVPTKIKTRGQTGSIKHQGGRGKKRGAARSRYAKLEAFYQTTLAAQAPSGSKGLAGAA